MTGDRWEQSHSGSTTATFCAEHGPVIGQVWKSGHVWVAVYGHETLGVKNTRDEVMVLVEQRRSLDLQRAAGLPV